MEPPPEPPRTRWLWLAAAWSIVAVLAVLHSIAVRDYVTLLDSMGRQGGAAVATPLSRPCPTMFADTQMWVRHALTLVETDAWRIRYTDTDNAPFGREVHWNSAFAWLIAAQGWLRHVVTGESMPVAVERALAWFNLPLLLALMALMSVWTARRAGALAGAFVAIAMAAMPDFYSGFAPNYADHHGVLAVANFAVVLGAFFMGGGWWRTSAAGSVLLPPSREAARGGAIFSALSGAVGIWISAPSVLPAIAFVGIGGLLAAWWHGRPEKDEAAAFDGDLWRLWGRVGAIASAVLYLLEYAPSHLGWRLEVNHPLYALAWWGGGELVAWLAEWRVGGARPKSGWQPVAAIAAVAAPLVVILAAGTKVFVFRDPFLQGLSARVVEGLALPEAIRRSGWGVTVLPRLPWIVAGFVIPLALALAGGRRDRRQLAFIALTCAAFLSMAFIQIRFFMNAGGAQICGILAALAALTQRWSQRWRTGLFLGAAALPLVPLIDFVREGQAQLQRKEITKLDALQPLYRDIAARLRQNQPEGDIVLLTNPDASTAIGYYGRLKTIGTLFWECLDGVKAAAQMSASTTMDQARARLSARSVTHVAVISENSFVREYYELANPAAKPDEWKQAFAFQIFAGAELPLWLEQVAYEPPADLKFPQLRVVLFRTRFAPAGAESAFQAARDHERAGKPAEAERALDRAIAIDGTSPEFWLFKAELLFARGALEPAATAIAQCLAHAPVAHRARIASSAGNVFYQNQAQATAVQLYRTSLEARFDPQTAANLAWILSTSRNDALRDPATALTLARRAATESPDSSHIVSALAAALAESGRHSEAVTVATRAVELARASGNAGTVTAAEARLRAYQAGQPWRQ